MTVTLAQIDLPTVFAPQRERLTLNTDGVYRLTTTCGLTAIDYVQTIDPAAAAAWIKRHNVTPDVPSCVLKHATTLAD